MTLSVNHFRYVDFLEFVCCAMLMVVSLQCYPHSPNILLSTFSNLPKLSNIKLFVLIAWIFQIEKNHIACQWFVHIKFTSFGGFPISPQTLQCVCSVYTGSIMHQISQSNVYTRSTWHNLFRSKFILSPQFIIHILSFRQPNLNCLNASKCFFFINNYTRFTLDK